MYVTQAGFKLMCNLPQPLIMTMENDVWIIVIKLFYLKIGCDIRWKGEENIIKDKVQMLE